MSALLLIIKKISAKHETLQYNTYEQAYDGMERY